MKCSHVIKAVYQMHQITGSYKYTKTTELLTSAKCCFSSQWHVCEMVWRLNISIGGYVINTITTSSENGIICLKFE